MFQSKLWFLLEKLKQVTVSNVPWYTVQQYTVIYCPTIYCDILSNNIPWYTVQQYTVIYCPTIYCDIMCRVSSIVCMKVPWDQNVARSSWDEVVCTQIICLQILSSNPALYNLWLRDQLFKRSMYLLSAGRGGGTHPTPPAHRPGHTFQECHDILMWPFICTIVCYMYKNA